MKFEVGMFIVVCMIIMVSAVNVSEDKRQLVVIMIDGARWDYVDLLDKNKLHGFSYFLKEGVRAQYVQTVFPSFSLPCWTTLCTGLYVENHDIVGNQAFDIKRDMLFSLHDISSTDSSVWWKAEQLWTTATKAGLKVATIEWSRSDISFNGVVPKIASAYNISGRCFSEKMAEAFKYVKEGFNLIMVYTESIDQLGHILGPGMEEVINGMKIIGEILENFIRSLISNNFADQVQQMYDLLTRICDADTQITSTWRLQAIKLWIKLRKKLYFYHWAYGRTCYWYFSATLNNLSVLLIGVASHPNSQKAESS